MDALSANHQEMYTQQPQGADRYYENMQRVETAQSDRRDIPTTAQEHEDDVTNLGDTSGDLAGNSRCPIGSLIPWQQVAR
jgi:hypothetical protein